MYHGYWIIPKKTQENGMKPADTITTFKYMDTNNNMSCQFTVHIWRVKLLILFGHGYFLLSVTIVA